MQGWRIEPAGALTRSSPSTAYWPPPACAPAARTDAPALYALLDEAPALLWRGDAWGGANWANQRMLDYFGIARLEDFQFRDVTHPDDAHAWAPAGGGAGVEQRLRLRDAAGAYRWFLLRARPLSGAEKSNGEGRNGEGGDWCGVAVEADGFDAEAQTAARAALVREFTGGKYALIWTADIATQRVQGLSPQRRAAWALPRGQETIAWTDWLGAVHPEDRPPIAGALDRAAAGETVHGRFRALSPAGAVRWMYGAVFPVLGRGDVVERVSGVLVDLTRSVDARVYLIESEPGSRIRLSRFLQSRGFKVLTFEDVEEFARISDDLLPGVALFSAGKAITEVIEAAGVLRLGGSRLPWIVRGAFDQNLNEVVAMMKLGAANVLTLDAAPEDIALAVRAASPSPFGPAHSVRGPLDASRKLASLTRREREVLEGLRAGGTNKSIAQSLSLSPRTVETYRAQLMDRLGVRTLANLLNLANEATLREP